MSEKFKPAASESFTSRADREEREEKEFWKTELEDMLSNKDESFRKKPLKELYGWVYNNLPQWLPPSADSYLGSHRNPDFDVYYKSKGTPRKAMLANEKMIADIDAYIEANNLMDMVRAIAQQKYRRSPQPEAGKRYEPPEKILTDGEIQQFYMDLYYALRRKGHSRQQIST
ncbi:hypothetical protein M0Q28_01525 [Patescibacteria group bacterium]|jgi:hypothetical protein|nr:hypothetical protein [Patescibacteria group bacterium]